MNSDSDLTQIERIHETQKEIKKELSRLLEQTVLVRKQVERWKEISDQSKVEFKELGDLRHFCTVICDNIIHLC